eukprot:1160045-Pelagomonas_calceolata.AAC.3
MHSSECMPRRKQHTWISTAEPFYRVVEAEKSIQQPGHLFKEIRSPSPPEPITTTYHPLLPPRRLNMIGNV